MAPAASKARFPGAGGAATQIKKQKGRLIAGPPNTYCPCLALIIGLMPPLASISIT